MAKSAESQERRGRPRQRSASLFRCAAGPVHGAGVFDRRGSTGRSTAIRGADQVKENVREVRVGALIDATFQDLRYALRTLRKSPAFALTAIVSLALAIGVITAVYSILDAALIRRLPVPEPDRLFTLATLQIQEQGKERPLEDTARSVQILRLQGSEWQSWRRSLDYYPEGELIWLEVDAIIRQQTQGQKSLNDFCRLFHGGESGAPKVVPYTFDDVVHTLNQVAPYDWAALLRERANSTAAHAPLGGIERGGWRVVYNDQPNVFIHTAEKIRKSVNAAYSLGFVVKEDGEFSDVIYGSPAYAAGIGPGMKLVAINGRAWSKDVLQDALRASTDSKRPIDLLIENAKFFKTYSVDYHDGIRNPHLERSGGSDVLGGILAPLTK